MVRPKIRKTLYWHKIAQVLLEHGLMPKDIALIMKSMFPQAEINGRHIGAYKRRLIDDGIMEKGLPKIITTNDFKNKVEVLMGHTEKTAHNWLKQMCEVKVVEKIKQGNYKKKLEIITSED